MRPSPTATTLDIADVVRGLGRAALCAGLSPAAVAALSATARVRSYTVGEVIVRAGDVATDVVVIERGVCAVDGRDVVSGGILRAGSALAAWAIDAPGAHAETVRAAEDVVTVELDIAHVRQQLDDDSGAALQPLRRAAHEAVREAFVVARAAHARDRARAGTLLITLTLLLSGAAFATGALKALVENAAGTTATTAPLIVLVLLAVAVPVRRLGLPARAYGLTTSRWRQAVVDGVVFAVPLVLALTAIKAWAITTLPAWQTRPLLDATTTLAAWYGDDTRALLHFIGANAVYVVFVVPVQELISRGVLQGALEELIPPPRAPLWATVVASVAFGACHLFLSVGVAVATVVLGLYIGAVYARTRNLLGACVLHAIVGTWALSVVRIHPLLSGSP